MKSQQLSYWTTAVGDNCECMRLLRWLMTIVHFDTAGFHQVAVVGGIGLRSSAQADRLQRWLCHQA